MKHFPESFSPTRFNDVNLVLHNFLAHIQALLENHFVGMYLVGSLALGDFDPLNSDIDFIVVTEAEIGDDLFDGLQDIHAQFAVSISAWAERIEAIYVPRSALSHTTPSASPYPQLEKGTRLFKAPLESGWVFQCISMRNHGVIIAGPTPRTVVGPIRPHDLYSASANLVGTWIEQAETDPTWLFWLRQRSAQSFVILTLCRLLYSLVTGDVTSKPRAAEWASRELGEPWTALIERAQAGQHEVGNITQIEEEETLAFIRFTLAQSNRQIS